MSKLLAEISNEIFTGAHPALPNDMIPLWKSLSNLMVFDGAVQPSPGHFVLTQKLETDAAVGMIEAELQVPGGSISERAKNLFWGNMTKLFRFTQNDSITYDASRLVGGAYGVGASPHQSVDHLAHRWSFAQFGEWITATNGHDIPQIFKNTDPAPAEFADLTQPGPVALPFTEAEIFRRVSIFLLALNTSVGSDFVHWSDGDNPHVWTPTAANSAGSTPIRNLNSQIMAAFDFGQGLGIYGRDQLHFARYVGPPGIIGIEKLLDGVGAFGKDAVCRIGSNHYGWGPRGIWRTDGSTIEYFDAPSVRDFIEKNLNYDQSSKIMLLPLTQYDTILCFYPQLGFQWNNAAFGLHLGTKTWWPQDYGRQCAVPGTVFDFAISGDSSGNIFMISEDVAPPVQSQGPLTLVENAIMRSGVGNLGVGQGPLGGDWGNEHLGIE